MKFYNDVKKHISPSALATWHGSRSSFIKSYFKGEKFEGNTATRAGTKIHGLIEGGFIKAEKVFGNSEQELVSGFRYTGVNVLGKPDDYGISGDVGLFVDYKTGGDNEWNKQELANDLKMKTTAWLVWDKLNRPEGGVIGYIEWFGMKWDDTAKELVPTNEDHAIFHHKYSAQELLAFEDVIGKTIDDVNSAYEKFSQGENLLVSEDLWKEYAELDAKKKQIEASELEPLETRMSEIKQSISDTLEFGGSLNLETPIGTFYFKETKKFEYPDDLEFQTESGNIMTLALGEEVSLAMSAAKKNYELSNEPYDIKRSLQFKAKKIK